jgi:Na+-driven multidrug efflux pump
MMVVMAGSTLLVFLPTWMTFSALQNHALWLAFTMFMTARAIGMHVWFRRMMNAQTPSAIFAQPDD